MRNFLYTLSLFLLLGLPLLSQAQGPGRQAYLAGENMRKQNRCNDAIAKYNEAINKEPSNYRYYFSKGKCEYKSNNWEDAIQSFKSVVEYRQDYSPAYSLLAKIYKTKKDLKEAAYYYEQAARYERSDSRKIQYKLLLINLLLKDGDTYQANKHIQEARRIAPDNPKILYYTAEIAASDGHWDDAKRDYERALQSDEISAASPAQKAKYYYGLGLAHSKLGDNASARRAWSKANFGPFKNMIRQQLQQTNHVHFYRIALSYYLNGEFSEAESYIQKALDLQNDFSHAYILRGKIEKKKGNISRAIDHFQRAIGMEKDPKKQARLYSYIASLQLSNNDSYGALKSLDQAISASPSSTKLLYMRAKAEYGAGRFTDVVVTVDKLLSAGGSSKNKARYNFLKGMAASQSRDNETAIKAFQNAMYGPYKPAAQIELKKLKGNGK